MLTLSLSVAAILGILLPASPSEDVDDLRILYVKDGTSDARAEAFETFLDDRFGEVTVTDHDRFAPGLAEHADVVLFDWSMKRGDLPPERSPLGDRDRWGRPTVLLGAAGLHHSCAWGVAGGSG